MLLVYRLNCIPGVVRYERLSLVALVLLTRNNEVVNATLDVLKLVEQLVQYIFVFSIGPLGLSEESALESLVLSLGWC